jgi:hypothetical protein
MELKCITRAEKNQHSEWVFIQKKKNYSNWKTGLSLQCGLVEVGEEPLELELFLLLLGGIGLRLPLGEAFEKKGCSVVAFRSRGTIVAVSLQQLLS